MSDKFEQRIRVESDEWDCPPDGGDSWNVHYVIYETENDEGRTVFELFKDDGDGNGEGLAVFWNWSDALHICLKLGQLIEYRLGQEMMT